MDTKELKNALDTLEKNLEGKNAEQIKTAMESFKSEVETSYSEKMAQFITGDSEEIKGLKTQLEALAGVKEELETVTKHANELDIKLKNQSSTGNRGDVYTVEMVKALGEGFEKIKQVRKGHAEKIEIKAVGDMTATNNLTGDVVFTYQPGVARVPSQMVNVSDLIPSIQSSTGTYIVYRETGAEGSISRQTVPGVAKTQKDYDFTAVTFTADYLAGYARFAKQMAQDLPFLQSFLPEALRRDYFKAENAEYYGVIKAGATASTATGTTAIERIIEDIGALEASDYMVNGVALNPADWATIAITKPSDFSLPSVVTFINGALTINGIPVYKASWVTAGEYLVGDWNQAKKVVVTGLAVEFFEQDADNVTKNLITARVESRNVCALDRPDGFIAGTTAPAT